MAWHSAPASREPDLRLGGAAGLLLLVDYADRLPLTHLTWLFSNAAFHQQVPTRLLLLLARSARPWPSGCGNWLRPDAATSPERMFCHVYARRKGKAQMIPDWPYSVVAALEPGRTSWTAMLDALRLGPADDETGPAP